MRSCLLLALLVVAGGQDRNPQAFAQAPSGGQRPHDRFVDESSPFSQRHGLPDFGIWSWVVARCPECQGLADEINTIKRRRADLLLQNESLRAEDTRLAEQLETDGATYRQAAREEDKATTAQLGPRIEATIARRLEIAKTLEANSAESSKLGGQQKQKEGHLRDCEQKCLAGLGGGSQVGTTGGTSTAPEFPITPIPNSPGANCSECQAAADMHAGAQRAFDQALEYRNNLWKKMQELDQQLDTLARERAQLAQQLQAGGEASIQTRMDELDASWRSIGARVTEFDRQVDAFEPTLDEVMRAAERYRRELEQCNAKCPKRTTTGGGAGGGGAGSTGATTTGATGCTDCKDLLERAATLRRELDQLADRLNTIQENQDTLAAAAEKAANDQAELHRLNGQQAALDRAHSEAVAQERQKAQELEQLEGRMAGCSQKCSTENSTSNQNSTNRNSTGNTPPPADPPKPPAETEKPPAETEKPQTDNRAEAPKTNAACNGPDCADTTPDSTDRVIVNNRAGLELVGGSVSSNGVAEPPSIRGTLEAPINLSGSEQPVTAPGATAPIEDISINDSPGIRIGDSPTLLNATVFMDRVDVFANGGNGVRLQGTVLEDRTDDEDLTETGLGFTSDKIFHNAIGREPTTTETTTAPNTTPTTTGSGATTNPTNTNSTSADPRSVGLHAEPGATVWADNDSWRTAERSENVADASKVPDAGAREFCSGSDCAEEFRAELNGCLATSTCTPIDSDCRVPGTEGCPSAAPNAVFQYQLNNPSAWSTAANADVEQRIQIKMGDVFIDVVIRPLQRADIRSWFNPLGLLAKRLVDNMERWRGSVGPRPLINPRDLREVEEYSGGQSAGLPNGVHVLLNDRGGSTGKTLGMQILNLTGQPVKLASMPFVLEPIKQQAQARIQQAFTRLAKAAPVNLDLAAYCLEFMKLPPSPNTLFRLAPAPVQKKYEAMSKVLRSAYRVQQAGLLSPDSNPAAYTDSIKQWSLWAVEQKFNEPRFTDAFLGHTKKNVEGAGRQWSKAAEDMIRKVSPNRWRDIVKVLQGAGLPVPQ